MSLVWQSTLKMALTPCKPQSPLQVWQIRPYHRAQRPLAAYLPFWDPGTELQDDPEASVEEITVELNHMVHNRMTPPHLVEYLGALYSPTSSRTGSPPPDLGIEEFPLLNPRMAYSPA